MEYETVLVYLRKTEKTAGESGVRGLNNVSTSLMRLMRTSKSGSGCATDADLVEMRVQSSGTLINVVAIV